MRHDTYQGLVADLTSLLGDKEAAKESIKNWVIESQSSKIADADYCRAKIHELTLTKAKAKPGSQIIILMDKRTSEILPIIIPESFHVDQMIPLSRCEALTMLSILTDYSQRNEEEKI